MPDYIQGLETYLGTRYKGTTRRTFRMNAKKFLAIYGVQPQYSRQQLIHFIDWCVSKNYKQASIEVILSSVRCMFRANNLFWPLHPQDMHLGLGEEEKNAPVIAPNDVRRLILGAHTDRYPIPQVVALATVWGLRNTEIAKVIKQGMDGQKLDLVTAKGGEHRLHVVPASMRDVLTFGPHSMTEAQAHKVWERAFSKHVRAPEPREGWHAVRRSVVTGLVEAGLSSYVIHKWMGWKQREVAAIYFRPTPQKIDRQVYEVHPYLPLWLGSTSGG